MNNRCVCCGEIIPEGRQYCLNCGAKGEKKMETKFELGEIVMTNGIASLMDKSEYELHFEIELAGCIMRHKSGDWGDLCEEDKQTNDYAVEHGERILSAYELFGTKIWIITEWDRSVTTILLPEEY